MYGPASGKRTDQNLFDHRGIHRMKSECKLIKELTVKRFDSDFDEYFPMSLQGIDDGHIDDILLLGISYLKDEKRRQACLKEYLRRHDV
jgi:hypothetical protein